VGRDCRSFADYLLNDAGVATLSGTSFGAFGEGYLRISYANSIPNLQSALERIESAINKLR
jgi:aspartate aminotransferase